MKLSVPQAPGTALQIMREAGYSDYFDQNTGKVSFSKRLGVDFFPKYHAYCSEQGADVLIDLHVDQKKPSYEGSRAHSGEYDGELVEREIARLGEVVARMRQEGAAEVPAQPRGFFGKLFG